MKKLTAWVIEKRNRDGSTTFLKNSFEVEFLEAKQNLTFWLKLKGFQLNAVDWYVEGIFEVYCIKHRAYLKETGEMWYDKWTNVSESEKDGLVKAKVNSGYNGYCYTQPNESVFS
jgi:hypothetical protein